jgi:anti-sigma regulatory factor (Ser/Thr protein kinase)
MPSNRVFEADYPAEPQVVHAVRERVDVFAHACGLTAEEMDAFKVALSEAFSNAVCHGSPLGSRNRVYLRCETDGQALIVQITDEGGGFIPSQIGLPAFEEWKTSGRGLFLMNELVDEVRFEKVVAGTRVRLIKRICPTDEQSCCALGHIDALKLTAAAIAR